MHEKRIMHRDLKPANIFIDNNGNLKVGDLGLSRQLSNQTLEAFSRVGTPLYMSPEVLQGKGYDFKSDMWSVGCIAYELCNLTSPFRKGNENLSLYDLF
jgi:NIMA (never in mitosis gene a)-related kinase